MNATVPLRAALRSPARPARIHTRRAAAHALLARAFAALRALLQRRRARDELAHLDDRMLRDIGLTRDWVAARRGNSFWQA